MSLPIIDISPFLSQGSAASGIDLDPAQIECSKAIHSACVTSGFFYLTGYDGLVDRELQERILSVSREFFALSDAEKDEIGLKTIKSDGARGYQRIGENVTMGKRDFHEGIDFYKPWSASPSGPSRAISNSINELGKPAPLQGVNLFPKNPPSFEPTIEEWISKMKILGRVLVHATLVGLELTPEEVKRVLDDTDDSFWVFRTIGYPPLPGDHNGISCGEHKDYGCYTLLFSDRTKGALQVLSSNGNWLDADPLEDCLVVNIGEMWEIWTNGLYKSTLHRVVHKGNNYRVSVPFFYEPNFDAKVTVLDSVVKREKERIKGEVTVKGSVVYGEFLMSKVSGNFLKQEL